MPHILLHFFVHCSLTHRIVIFMRRQTNLKYSTFSTNFCVLFTTINYIKILVDDYFIPVSYKRPFIIKLNYSHYLRIRFPFTLSGMLFIFIKSPHVWTTKYWFDDAANWAVLSHEKNGFGDETEKRLNLDLQSLNRSVL